MNLAAARSEPEPLLGLRAMSDVATLIPKYEAEVARMDEMLTEFEREKRQAVYSPLVGAVLAIPAYFWRPWAGVFCFCGGFAIMACWLYLTYGHITERRFQRTLALKELATLRVRERAMRAPPHPVLV